MKQQKQSGLTMVEITISIIIIGLLIAGILKGGQVITNARLVGLVNTIKATEAAIISFQDFYGYKPGDVSPNKVPGCDAANFCNTLLSSTLESGTVNDDLTPGTRGWTTKFNPNTPNQNESFLFWKHLALAGMLSNIDQNADTTAPFWGVTHPETPFGGGLEFYEDIATTVRYAGELIRISADGIFPGGGTTGILNPLYSLNIDTKIDDGDPNNGLVFADYGVTDNQCKNPLGGGVSEYRNDLDATCILYIGF